MNKIDKFEKIINNNKPIRLTQKEIDRGESYVNYDGIEKKYTIIRRRQPNGQYLIASVNINTGLPIEIDIAETKEDCSKSVKEVNRWMCKLGKDGKMSDKSRHRNKKRKIT